FFFDMEFIRGMDGVTWLRRASYGEVVALGDRLCRYLELIAAGAPLRPTNETLFEALYTKLCDVLRKTDAISAATLGRVFVALEKLQKTGGGLSPTLCHGDLTLENLVIDADGKLWLLDFLDAPFEHWWQDVSKLHQDLDGGWYLLAQAPIAQCVLDYLSRRL